MTSGFYPVAPRTGDADESSCFATTYDTMMNAPPLVPKSHFAPGYQGHQQGVKYVIGQSCPAGTPTHPNLRAAHTIRPVDCFAPVHQRARSEQPLADRATSRRRAPTPDRRRVYFFPQLLGGSYVPPAAPAQAGAPPVSSPRQRPAAVSPAFVTRADGRGTGYHYDNVRAVL